MEIRKIYTNDADYSFFEELIQEAFPKQERRDTEKQRILTDTNSQFHCNIISDKKIPIGLITYWEFKDFLYIEHFAISPQHRNQGYGERILQRLKAQINVPIVLEAEEPNDTLSKRRINFYQRLGFVLHEQPYLQPPYRKGEEWLPLKLMTYGNIDMNQKYHLVKAQIYKGVYQV